LATLSRDQMAAIAATRFGLGARPGELAAVGGDAQGWLRGQITAQGADLGLATTDLSAQRIRDLREYRQERRADRADDSKAEDSKAGEAMAEDKDDPVKAARRLLRESTAEDFLARARLAATTPAGFRERWAMFWCNHFTVSAIKLATATVVGPFEQEAIRPRVFGRFEDLLAASTAHPAMMLYLDQAQSIGPNSQLAGILKRRPQARGQGGLNENLAREVLELHTVGVDGGYCQADVTEFARCLTGWSIGGQREPQQFGRFVFRDIAHEPGARTVMGRRYGEDGAGQAAAVLKDLAASASTARHVCGKLARHFVSDTPPPELVAGLERAWMNSGGHLGRVAEALIASPQAWAAEPGKFKTPYEYVVSGYRAIGGQPSAIERLAPALTGMGQRPYSPPSPKGWPDEAAYWAAPDALIKRMVWAEAFSAVVAPDRDPEALARTALGARLSPAVATAVRRAESRPEALSLLLMSPEFLRR
jgi:uncharacterized protein (DUF1800 family)